MTVSITFPPDVSTHQFFGGFVSGQVIQVEVEPTSQSVVSELKPVPFEVYCSPLRVFKSYR